MGRILVVDDDAGVRLTLRTILELAGHEVIEASNGKVAVSSYRRNPVDVLILDLFMPEKEGLEVIMELKRDFPDVKIIAISGGGSLGIKESSLRAAGHLGAARTFAKPFKIEDIIAAVTELLGGEPQNTENH
jgi:CheY-like chemotaxis protein